MREALRSIPSTVSSRLVTPVIPALKRRSGEIRTSRYPWLHGEFEPRGDPDSTNQQNNAVSQHIVFLPSGHPGLPGSAHQPSGGLSPHPGLSLRPQQLSSLLSLPSWYSLYSLAPLGLGLPMVHHEDSRNPRNRGAPSSRAAFLSGFLCDWEPERAALGL